MTSLSSKTPVVVLIGNGSKLPILLKEAKKSSSKFKIVLVVSHKANSPGIDLATKNKIPAVYFKLPDFRQRAAKSKSLARKEYMRFLGWFISQKEYSPKLLVFAGWYLVMDQSFFRYFKADIGNGYAAINLHPALMTLEGEKQVILPDKTKVPVIRGEQEEVLKAILKEKHTYFGPSTHFMIPTKFDTGKVIKRAFIKVAPSKTTEELKKRLMPAEDKILTESINEVVTKYIR